MLSEIFIADSGSWAEALKATLSAPTFWPAFLSAVAAFFSVLAAYRIYKIHRDNRIDVVRAELILLGLDVKEMGGEKYLFIQKVVNVGKGPALSFGLAMNRQDTAKKINYQGHNLLRDVRAGGGEESYLDPSLDVLIPIDSCLERIDNYHVYKMTIRLFWTDLHEKKHLVNILLQINPNEKMPEPTEGMHVLKNGLPRIFMIRRKACWFESDRELRDALDAVPNFDHCPRDTPLNSNL